MTDQRHRDYREEAFGTGYAIFAPDGVYEERVLPREADIVIGAGLTALRKEHQFDLVHPEEDGKTACSILALDGYPQSHPQRTPLLAPENGGVVDIVALKERLYLLHRTSVPFTFLPTSPNALYATASLTLRSGTLVVNPFWGAREPIGPGARAQRRELARLALRLGGSSEEPDSAA